MIVDAYFPVCPGRLMDAISQRHPGAEVAAVRRNLGLGEAGLAAVPGGDLHRIMRL